MTELETVVDAEVVDLTAEEATAITQRIRHWVGGFPATDVKRAYFGRIWLKTGHKSWSDWCDSELGGFKLPPPQRREVIAELAGSGVSNRAIADVAGVTEGQVRLDKKEVRSDYAPEKVTGQDGKTYTPPQPRPKPPPKPPPTPLAGRAKQVSTDLKEAIQHVQQLAASDPNSVRAECFRGVLEYTRDACTELLAGAVL